MKAERDRRAIVLEAEGEKASRVLRAEGLRDAAIAEAEGERQRLILKATGEAGAIEKVTGSLKDSGVNPAQYLVAMEYLKMMREIATSQAGSKTVFMPYESSNVLGAIGGIKELLGITGPSGAGFEGVVSSDPCRNRASSPRVALEDVCRRHHIQRLSLFGSVLRDDFGPQSDVDLLVEFEPGHTPGFAIIQVEEDLSRVFGGRRIDLVNPKYVNRWIRKRVLTSAQLLYAA